MMLEGLNDNGRKMIWTVAAVWLTVGIPFVAGLWAAEQARPIVGDAIEIHSQQKDPDMQRLQQQSAVNKTKLEAIDEQLDRVEQSVDRLLELQLSRRD